MNRPTTTQYDNTNSGAIFANDRKEKDTHPDRTGSINIEGVEYWINGWLKKTKDGKPFLSVSLRRKDEGAKPASAKPATATAHADDGDDIPF